MKQQKIKYALDKDTYKIGTIHYSTIGYEYTDELFDYLKSIGKKVLCVNYGVYNFYDVIEWVD